jgi:hypothetical protein
MSQTNDRQKWINLSIVHEKEISDLQGKVAALQAEVERLRKAGDDLAVAWARVRTDYHTWDVAVKAWDAAKEGKGAK